MTELQKEVALSLIKRYRKEHETRNKLDAMGVTLEISSVFDITIDAIVALTVPEKDFDDAVDYVSDRILYKIPAETFLNQIIKRYEPKRK
jgi:hypothetical protein